MSSEEHERVDLCPICDRSHRREARDEAERVLVVEDDPAIANLIAYNLEQDGYRVAIVADGVEALRRLMESPPDLLVLDLLLPLQSGWQVLREMRLRRASTLATLPVLVVSALACERLEQDLARLGAQRVLGKPFALKELLATVRELLDAARERSH